MLFMLQISQESKTSSAISTLIFLANNSKTVEFSEIQMEGNIVHHQKIMKRIANYRWNGRKCKILKIPLSNEKLIIVTLKLRNTCFKREAMLNTLIYKIRVSNMSFLLHRLYVKRNNIWVHVEVFFFMGGNFPHNRNLKNLNIYYLGSLES